MRIPGVPLSGLLWLSLLLAAAPVRAQEEQGGMGLDLSDTSETETPQPQSPPSTETQEMPGMGMDLSGETSSVDLLPRVVLVGLATPERAAAAVAPRWLKAFYSAIRTNDQWILSSPLKEVREKLGEGYTAALNCTEPSCLAEPADTLEADLLVTARLSLEDNGWTLRLWTYERDRNRLKTDELTGRSPRDAKFQKAGANLLAQRIWEMAQSRSLLEVKVNVPQAVVRLGERTLGVGSIAGARVAPGEANLVVDAEGFTSYEKTIVLKPGEKNTVEVYLELAGPPPDSPPSEVAVEATKRQERSSGPTILSRPALYTAVVGVLAIGAGVMVGQQAKKIADRAVDADGDGIADITRRERIEGQNKANLSTALVAGGAAVAGGSAVWLFLVPDRSAAPRAEAPGLTPGGGGEATTALHLFLGGNF